MSIVYMRHPDLTSQPQTKIVGQTASGSSSLTVTNSEAFASSKYILIGGYESPTAEIRLAGTISSATAIPITSTTNFPHNSGEHVQKIPYNQIEITYSEDLDDLWDSLEYSTLADASAVATWNSLATISIQPGQKETIYDDQTVGRSYRWRYKNSTDTIYSSYQAYILPNGYEEKAVKSIHKKATDITNKDISANETGQIDFEFLKDQTNMCLRAIDFERRRWSQDQSFELVLSEITAGEQGYFLQSAVQHKRGVWNVRINDGPRLKYIDKREWDRYNLDVHMSAIQTASLTSASTSVSFFDTSNFDDSGTFDVWTNGTKNTVSYSANNRTTNVLTLTDAATEVTVTHPTGTVVWQGATFGVPTRYTIYNKKIIFDVVPDDTIHQKTVEGDVYLACQQIDSEDDYIRIENPNIVVYWLCSAIMMKVNNPGMAAEWERKYKKEIINMKRVETTGQRQFLKPAGWRYRTTYNSRHGMINVNDN